MSLKNLIISETEDFADIVVNLGYLDDFNYNGIMLSSESDPESSVNTLVNTPVVAYYNRFNDDFEGHNVEFTRNGVKFGTQAIGNHTKSWIENCMVTPVFSEEEVELPCMFAEARIYKSRFPNAYNVIKKRIEEDKMFTSWELKTTQIENVQAENLRVPNPRKANSWTMLGNCLLGTRVENGKLVDVTPAYGKNSKVLVMSEKQDPNIDLELAEALSQDIISESIKINNSKDSAVNGKWSNPEATLYKPLMEADNSKSLLEEAYLMVGGNYENSPSTELKYPHHVIRGGELVIHIRGLISAFVRLRGEGYDSGKEIDHIRRHYRELDMQTDLFESKYNDLVKWFEEHHDDEDDKWMQSMLDYLKKIEREETAMEERIKELESTIEQLNAELKGYKEAEANSKVEEMEKEIAELKESKETLEKDLADTSKTFAEISKVKESLEAEVVELKTYKVKVEELEKAENERILNEKKDELKSFATKDGFIEEAELESDESLKSIFFELTLENFESSKCKIEVIQGRKAMELFKAQKENKEDVETSDKKDDTKQAPQSNLNGDSDGHLDALGVLAQAFNIRK